jgi:hypothetical protein
MMYAKARRQRAFAEENPTIEQLGRRYEDYVSAWEAEKLAETIGAAPDRVAAYLCGQRCPPLRRRGPRS